MSARLATALALLVTACATAGHRPRPAPDPGEIRPEDSDLSTKNDEELFAIGGAARQAGDHVRAAAAFSRLSDAFPGSRHARTALLEAGIAWRQLERWDLALPRFRRLAEAYRGPDADEASFFLAEALYQLGRRAEARETLDRLAARDDLDRSQVARALTQRGAVELEDGQPEVAERSLALALSSWAAAESGERGAHYPAKAHFYMGEVHRSYLLAVNLDPSGDEALLAQQLERAAQLLLSAQGHYLDAMRTGEAGWAVAACERVGELYEGLHERLMEAPLPAGLAEELAEAYRDELRGSVRVLVAKAILAYEEALSAARRAGVESDFVPRAEEALGRLRRILAEGEDAS